MVPVGTTGESATLSHEEHRRCIQLAIDTCKGTSTKVIAGAGSNSTKEAIELAQYSQKVGADAVLCVAPYYNKPNQEGLYKHYEAIAKSIDIGLILYNVPARTGSNINAKTTISLMQDIDNIIAVKEASGNLDVVQEIHQACPNKAVISGDDSLNYSIMALGGKGFIGVSSNLVPDLFSELFELMSNKDYDRALTLNYKLLALNQVLFIDTNPIVVKTAAYMLGLIPDLEFRLPLTALNKTHQQQLKAVLQTLEIKQ